MKTKLIATIISICIIGGAATTVLLNSKVNDTIANNAIKEKSIDENNIIEDSKNKDNDENKLEANKVSKEENVTNEATSENGIVESAEPTEGYVEEKVDKVNNVVEDPVVEYTEVIDEQINTETYKPEVEIETPVYDSNFLSEVENMIFNKVNEERSKNGLAPLSYNSTMEHYARIKSQDMGDRGYFDHINPEGDLITSQMQRDGISYNSWGENIAYISGVSDAGALANQFMTNWMNSSGHRANILSSDFTSIGIGVYKIGNTVYATQEFYR